MLPDSAPALLVIAPSNAVRWANQEAADLLDLPLPDLLSTANVLSDASKEADSAASSLAELVSRVRRTGRVRKRIPTRGDAAEGTVREWLVEARITTGPAGEDLAQLLLWPASAATEGSTPATADVETAEQRRLREQYETIFENATDALFLIDVTHTAEDALRRREQYLSVTLDSIGDGVIVTDTEGRVTRMNEEAERLTGWPSTEADGRPVSSVFHVVNVETREPVENPVERVLDEGTTVGLANDTLLIGRDGTERNVADSAAPIRTADGDLLGVVMVFRDITEKYERQAALRASEERWRRLVDQSPEAIYVTVDGELRYLNEAAVEVLGAEGPEDLLGRSVIDFVPSEARATFQKRRRQLQEGQATEPLEQRIVRLDGEDRIVVVQSVPVRYEGEPAVQTVIRDVTEQRTLEARLRQAQRLETVGTLAGGIAHDFNNILHASQAYLELVYDDLPPGHEARTYLSRTEKGLHRAEELVEKLMTFSRQRSSETREAVGVAGLVRDMLDLVEPSLPSTIEVRTHLEDDCVVVGDPGQLKQVIMNLVTNAGQAMTALDADHVLEVVVQTVDVDEDRAHPHLDLDPGPYVCLTVSDTGAGMDQATKERIFEPFFTTKEVDEGTGLGLSVVHGIVQAHEGTVDVRSRPGEGTTFDVYLPAASDHTGGTTARGLGTADDDALDGHVLVVDDEGEILEMERIRLRRFGCEVTTVRETREALEAIEARADVYDLVLTDYAMPDMSGLELVRTLRERGHDVPVILTSGYSAQVSDAEACDAGVSSFLRKPVGTRKLKAVLAELL